MQNKSAKMLKYIASLILVIMMIITIIPIQTQAVDELLDSDMHTVVYMVNGVEYDAIEVLNETLAIMPDDPVPNEGQAPFLCWYKEGEDVPFSTRRIITEDITLVAHFSYNNLVTYYDHNNIEIELFEYAPDEVIPELEFDEKLSLGNEFLYWYAEGNPDTPFEFGNTISNSVVLLPRISQYSIAVFITNGPEVDSQAGLDGFYAVDPKELEPDLDLTREGYEFSHWSSEMNGSTVFDFENTEINGAVRIYAVWKSLMVDYTIDFWNEVVDFDGDPGNPIDPDNPAPRENFERVYSKYISKGALAGSSQTITSDQALSHYRTGGNNVINLLNYSTYISSEKKTISGTGTTVINVYFKRTEFTFSFDPRKANRWTTSTAISVPAAYLKTRDGVTQSLPYSITVKLGQNVTNIWPIEVGRESTATTYFTNWNDYYGNGSDSVSASHISFSFAPNSSGRPTKFSANLGVSWRNAQYTEIRRYYLQNLNDERVEGDVEFTTKYSNRTWEDSGKTHYYTLGYEAIESRQASTPYSNAVGWPGRDIPGFDTITAKNTAAQNPDYLSQYYQTVESRDEGVADKDAKNFYINYYMRRKSYVLTLKTNGGVLQDFSDYTEIEGPITSDAEKIFLYDENINLPPDPVLENHEFVGWYTDEDLTKPVDTTKMPAGNVTYYAKYSTQYTTVNYYDGNDLIATKEYERGEYIMDHETGSVYDNYVIGEDVPGKGEFQGWFYQIGEGKNSFVQFPLEVRLTQETYNLYAEWKTTTYTVTYFDKQDDDWQEVGSQSIISGNYNTLALSGQHALSLPGRTDYTRLVEWNTKPDGTGTRFLPSTPILENINVYAMWEFNIPFVFTKVDGSNMDTKLSGATFILYSCSHEHNEECGGLTDPNNCTYTPDDIVTESSDCWKPIYKKTTRASGKLQFDLPEGTYQLVETEAPDGYDLPIGQWRITISSTAPEILTITAMGDVLPPAFVNQDEEFTYLLTNRKKFVLPITGETGVDRFYKTGTVLLAMAFTLIVFWNRKKLRSFYYERCYHIKL